MSTRTLDKYQDILDSRDIIERIDDLEMERQQLVDEEDNDELAAWDESDSADELKALKALQDEAEGYCSDWKYGAALIRDSYFTDYAMELLQDCGDLPKDIPHYIVIDWEATARNIQQDYTSVEFEDVTYWVR